LFTPKLCFVCALVVEFQGGGGGKRVYCRVVLDNMKSP
jgi:hypothetical protein